MKDEIKSALVEVLQEMITAMEAKEYQEPEEETEDEDSDTLNSTMPMKKKTIIIAKKGKDNSVPSWISDLMK